LIDLPIPRLPIAGIDKDTGSLRALRVRFTVFKLNVCRRRSQLCKASEYLPDRKQPSDMLALGYPSLIWSVRLAQQLLQGTEKLNSSSQFPCQRSWLRPRSQHRSNDSRQPKIQGSRRKSENLTFVFILIKKRAISDDQAHKVSATAVLEKPTVTNWLAP
jgi:hypothetical protein